MTKASRLQFRHSPGSSFAFRISYLSRTFLTLLLGCYVLASFAWAQEFKPGGDDLSSRENGTRFRLVSAAEPDQDLATRLYWRTCQGTVAAQTTPLCFRMGGTDVIAPHLSKQRGSDGRAITLYPVEGRGEFQAGKYVLQPGGIAIEFEGVVPTSKHPAVQVVNGDVRILCAPVRLEAVDPRGAAVPSPTRLFDDKGSLLREDAQFTILTLWLPVGGRYLSSFGAFALTAQGKIDAGASRLAPGVEVTESGLRKTLPAAAPRALVAAETVSLHSAAGALEMFVPAVVPPGGRLWLAILRKRCQQVTGQPPAAAQASCLLDDGADGRPLPLEAGEGPDSAARAEAAKALRSPADDLAWFSTLVPPGMAGPAAIKLKIGHAGPTETAVLLAELGSLHLVPHRWRTVFAHTETAVYELLCPRGTPAGEAKLLAQPDRPESKPIALGHWTLPAVESRPWDARLFTVHMADLPPGRYRLWIEAAARRSGQVPLTVVSWLPRAEFFANSISGCTTCWPTSDEGLDMMEKAGLEMLSATGPHSQLDTSMPQIDAALAARLDGLGLPADLALRPVGNDRLLERMLQRRLRMVDLVVCRALSLYNEGLSYHHSYPPSVDRMIRRMQIFTQQTADYPSFWGINYSWFPSLFGYIEGGVPTDAHAADRNRVLAERVKAAGCPPLGQTQREWLAAHKTAADPKDRAEVLRLTEQAVANWRTTHELGWGRHNAIYNAAVREVRPGTACTLFENAGHNENKRVRAMFRDMDAQCYESYTDFGDWPMSAAFVVDWSRGQSPGQPVWLTTCWGTSSEGKMKSLFHAFARGMAGGGVPMEGNFDLAELTRRGTGIRFLGQYGAVAARAVPDRRVAILARTAGLVFVDRAMWNAHAAYYHLTRLGYPPVILSDEDMTGPGVPEYVKVLVLVKEQLPWEPALRDAIGAFLRRGGKVVSVGDCAEPIEGAIAVAGSLKNLWEVKGFHPDAHGEMWREFSATWQTALGAAMGQTGLAARATTDPDRGLALTLDAGPVRYVVVLADAKGTHSNAFEPGAALPLSLEGTGWSVRDLVRQETLPAKTNGGRTETSVELLTEPAKLLALYPAEPAEVALRATPSPRLGSFLEVEAEATGTGGAALGPVPVRCTLAEPGGTVRAELFRAAGQRIRIPLAAHDRPGAWRLSVEELLTGHSATAELNVAAAPAGAESAQPIGDVHVVNRDHLLAFVARPGEKLVIVDPEQPQLLSLARTLAEDLKKAGVGTRLWQVKPEDYDTQPVRWYPTVEDQKRQEEIDAGRRIGCRQNLQAYIDRIKRAHDPERGGYAEIDPPFMVGQDCILFSGGRLAESLRAVSPWLATPHSPGAGQGRLLVCFSPFMANRQALAVVANDEEGLARAARELVRTVSDRSPKQAIAATATALEPLGPKLAAKNDVQPVERPYGDFTPIRRVVRLMAGRDGSAAVLLRGEKDNLAMVDPEGKLKSVFTVDPALGTLGRLDLHGRLLWPTRSILKKDPGWGFPTEMAIAWQCITPEGVVSWDLATYAGPAATPGYASGVALADDGESGVLGRPGGLLFRFGGASRWNRYDDLGAVRSRFEVLYPRQPVGVAFSPDGRYAALTMDSRPPFGGMVGPTPRPTGAETLLLDLQTGKPAWSLRGADDRKSMYAFHAGFAAVARDGVMTALADFDGGVYLVDKSGKVVAGQQVADPGDDGRGRTSPTDGISVGISDDGATAAMAFARVLVVTRGERLVRVPLEGLVSMAVLPDGQLVVAGLADGRLVALDPDGRPAWTATPGGAGPLVAATGTKEILAATGPGDLVRFDVQGHPTRRIHLAGFGDDVRRGVHDAPDAVRRDCGPEVVEPPTLALAQEHLAAKQVAIWKPAAAGRELLGRRFFPLEGQAELSADGSGDFFAHLVYRRPDENKLLRVEIVGADGAETFRLDLPAPQYRSVDLPLRGPSARVRVVAEGPAEIAQLSLWSFRWPGPNLAYVKPAGMESVDRSAPASTAGSDILDGLEEKTAATGKMKNCRIWFPNTDPDSVRGSYLPVPLDPLEMVNGRRFGNGKVPPWTTAGQYAPSRGGFFTVDFGEALSPRLVATYDHADRQSLLATNLAVFGAEEKDMLRGGPVLAGAIGNDQFWRLFPLGGAAKVRVLGVHVFKDSSTGVGLSEVEVYK